MIIGYIMNHSKTLIIKKMNHSKTCMIKTIFPSNKIILYYLRIEKDSYFSILLV